MSRASDFLSIFAKLEKEILERAANAPQLSQLRADEQRKKLRTYIGSLDVLDMYGKDRVVIEHLPELRLYGQLRNALAHNYDDDDPIADPRKSAVNGIRDLYDKISAPQKAQNIMTSNPTSFKIDSDVYDSLGLMDREWFTSVPVYSGDEMIGVLSERSMLRWAAASADDEVKLAELETLRDIEHYFDKPDASGTDLYYFVSKDLDVYSVRDYFNSAIRGGKRVAAIFVTHSGKKTESLLGIVTAWDLYRIDK